MVASLLLTAVMRPLIAVTNAARSVSSCACVIAILSKTPISLSSEWGRRYQPRIHSNISVQRHRREQDLHLVQTRRGVVVGPVPHVRAEVPPGSRTADERPPRAVIHHDPVVIRGEVTRRRARDGGDDLPGVSTAFGIGPIHRAVPRLQIPLLGP